MVDKLIEEYIDPIIVTECMQLGIDPLKIKNVKACYPKPFEYDSYVQANHDGTYTIRIGIENTDMADCIRTFLHELRHLKFYEEKQRHSELKCSFYAWKRYLQLLLSSQSTED